MLRTDHPPPAPSAKRVHRTDHLEDDDPEDATADDQTADAELPNDADLEEIEEASLDVLPTETTDGERKRKRKRKDVEIELEDVYMQRLARGEEKDAKRAAEERASKRQKASIVDEEEDEDEDNNEDSVVDAVVEDVSEDEADEDDLASPPPKHETVEAADVEQSKANRTVFLGNVSTNAISSKSARKTLTSHLASFFASIAAPKEGESKHKVESIRFRSTPYASAIPKKAAFAKKALMDATTRSTNAYVVYSSPLLAREAARRLNGTVILDRHLRVDEVAHPAKVDHKRCIFVGNLGFVDDESNIQDANEEEGREKRKRGKEPADVEEGLWRAFGKCGTVESVRVIRDSTTRVGKGIAYVQFDDENAVEAALLYNEKKFPPMLPRKLRVSRAKAQKRNAKPGSGRPSARPPSANGGYQRKISAEEASRMGRTGKLYGRAAAANVRRSGGSASQSSQGKLGAGIRAPESFVFEGHRASSKSGKSGLKLGKPGKKKGGKPTNRSAKRGAAFKAGKGK